MLMIHDHGVHKPKYRCHQNHGYSLLNDLWPALDTDADYFIDAYAAACEGRPVIVRCDGQAYDGHMRWIVDKHNLTELTPQHETHPPDPT